ncbi:MAG: single-stranded DNA-binding protein [Lachnospiraceae bacterium]|nr:single-stranded DNA-binding protein [Lachnospiraceae bacterium]
MNKVILMGRLTRDPEVRYSQGASQTSVARFSVAVDRRFKREGEPDADFFNCTAFGKQAEFIERYLHKGTKVVLCGRIQNDNYTNKDGQMVYSVRVMVDEIEFAESKNASGGNAGGGYNNAGGYNNGGYAGGGSSAPAPSGAGDGFMNIPDGIDEELPFN